MKSLPLLLIVFSTLFSGCTERLENELSSVRKSLDEANAKRADLAAQVAKLSGENESLRTRLDEMKTSGAAQATAAEKAASVHASAITAAQEKEGAWRSREAELLAQVSQLKEANAQAKAELQAVRAEGERVAAQHQRGEVTGMVSYYFNANYGQKPDVGSRVFIFQKADVPEFNGEDLTKYLLMRLAMQSTDGGKWARQIQEKYNVRPEDLKPLSEALSKAVMKVTTAKSTTKTTADGSGAFRAKVKPGDYCVIIQSAHRDSMSSLEIGGQLSYNEITVGSGDQVSVDAKFYP